MGVLSEPVVVVALAGWIGGFGLVAARMARDLDRIQAAWFVVGAILGPVALLVLRKAPPSLCRTCGTPTRGWTYTCWWCREDVRTSNSSVVSMEARLSGRAPVTPSPAPIDGSGPAVSAPRSATNPPAIQQPERAREPSGSRPVVAASAQAPVTSLAARTASTGRAAQEAFGRTPPEPSQPVAYLQNGAAAKSPRTPEDPPRPIATAVFVVGSARLEPGRRYGLAIRENRLLVLGPIDVDPWAVALDRPVDEVDARAVEGRLVISEPHSGSGLALAFMAVTGATTDAVAAGIAQAAREASGSS